jgi:HNH endonuclease
MLLADRGGNVKDLELHERLLLAGGPDAFCYYCGKTRPPHELFLEHKTPKSRGGSDIRTNLVSACRSCNVFKGTMTFDEFKNLVRERLGNPHIVFFGETVYQFVVPEEPPRAEPTHDDIWEDNAAVELFR